MLHILVGATCNNNCVFCMEAERDRRASHIRAQGVEDVRAMIATYPDTSGILFTSGEPTLSAALVTYVRWARERGFRSIGLISNGRRLAYPAYARRLVLAGLNTITVSLHGHTARLHERLTRTPLSFTHTVAALNNLADLRNRVPFELRTSTVVTQRTLPHLVDIHRFLSARPVDLIVLNVMMPQGRGAGLVGSLMPRYPEVVDGMLRLCDGLSPAELARLRVEDVPPCILARLPGAVRGDCEEYEQFEPVGSTGTTTLTSQIPQSARSSGAGGAEQVAASGRCHEPCGVVTDTDPIRLQAHSDYYLTRRSLKEHMFRVAGAPCQLCRLHGTCPGVWEPYVARYGWQDFVPLGDHQDGDL